MELRSWRRTTTSSMLQGGTCERSQTLLTRTEFIRQRDGEAAVAPYLALMRQAYRRAVLKGAYRKDGSKGPINKRHPFRRAWIEGYLEFKR